MPPPRIFLRKFFSMYTETYELTAGADLRIMTNNVWNRDRNSEAWAENGEDCSAPARAPGFVRVYTETRPDVVNCQEMTALMLKLILDGLREKGFDYAGLAINDPVDDFTALIYNRETLTLLESGHHVFDYASDAKSKGYTWGRFEHKATGRTFVSLSTHLWWRRESVQPGSNAWRESQAREIVEISKELEAKFGCPVFVQGDFNTRMKSGAFAEFIRGGFSNCRDLASVFADDLRGYHRCGPAGYSREMSPGAYSENGIDHMLVRGLGSAEILSFRHIIPDYYFTLSDHYPVCVDVRLG